MDDIYDFNSSEWGEIVLEESSNNRRLREAPYKMVGIAFVAGAIMDLAMMGALFFMSTRPDYREAVTSQYLLIILAVLALSGIVAFMIGYLRLGYKAKPYTLLQKGITEGSFRSFEEMPVIELHGPKDKVLVLTRSGSAEPGSDKAQDKKGYAHILYTPDELDFGGFAASLRKFGYGGGEETTTAPPPKDAPAEEKKDDGKDTKPPDAPADGKKDEKK
jgi:hypothetical protein